MKRERKKHTGWTLAELLVVMAIIATLAAIVWAVLQPARDRSIQTECAAKLRQIWIALETYRQDAGGIDPPVAQTVMQTGLPVHVDHYMNFLLVHRKQNGPYSTFCGTSIKRFGYPPMECRRSELTNDGRIRLVLDPNACSPFMNAYWLLPHRWGDPDLTMMERDNKILTTMGSDFEILYDDYHNPGANPFRDTSFLTITVHLGGHVKTRRLPFWPDYRTQRFISVEQ